VGGGAAGFFTAINIVEKKSKLKIAILECRCIAKVKFLAAEDAM
jgi:predicted flavoprotein YhiN